MKKKHRVALRRKLFTFFNESKKEVERRVAFTLIRYDANFC